MNSEVDQKILARDISNKIPYEFLDLILVKPLDPIKVKKEFSKPVEKGSSVDENGVNAIDYNEVVTEIKEVDSDYRKGIVLKLPATVTKLDNVSDIEIGDVIVFRDRSGAYFDLVKDSKLVRLYDVVAIEL